MKRGMVIAAALLVLMVAFEAKAEMRITPEGVTTPDNAAGLHLSGRFYSEEDYDPEAAVISGVNSYAVSSPSLGGYFSAAGTEGRGVYARATGEAGWGVSGIAYGTYGKGVYGIAIDDGDVTNYGGYFLAQGQSGRAVYGKALRAGDVTNYGGYFLAQGQSGRGVYGEALYTGDATNYGGYFTAAGTYGRGVYGKAIGEAGTAVYGEATNTGGIHTNYGGYFTAAGSSGQGVHGCATGSGSVGVYGQGGNLGWDFYAGGSGTNYGPFTGAHEVKFAPNMPEGIIPGLIVSATGMAEVRKDTDGNISLSSTLPTVTLSARAMDKAVFGVIVSQSPLPGDHWYEAQEGKSFGVVNALGEGRVWVTDRNGNIEAGDYITTSVIPGYGQRQEDDLLHAYTLGKAIETIDWDQVAETVQHRGRAYKAYLIAVVYTSG